MGMLEIQQKAFEEGEKRRLAQLAARTPEQIAQEEEKRAIEIETHQKRTGAPTPEKVIPVPTHVDDLIVSGKNEVGAIIEYRGEEWLVTSCYQESGAERRDIRDEMDEVPPAGWYSALFRVRTNHQAMQIVAEQVRAGQAQFTGPCTVKLADEQYTSDLRDLAYDAERGLHVRS